MEALKEVIVPAGTLPDREAAALCNLPPEIEKLRYDEKDGYVSLGLRFNDPVLLANWMADAGPRDRQRYEMILNSEHGKRFYVRGTEVFQENKTRPNTWRKTRELTSEFEVPVYMVGAAFGDSSDKITAVELGLSAMKRAGDPELADFEPAGEDPMEAADTSQKSQPAPRPVSLSPETERWVAEGMPSYAPADKLKLRDRVRALGVAGAAAETYRRRRDRVKTGLAIAALAAVGAAILFVGTTGDHAPEHQPSSPGKTAPEPKPKSGPERKKPQSRKIRTRLGRIALRQGGNPWVLSERVLQRRGVEYPSDARIMRFDMRMARLNPHVYQYFGDSSRFIPVGTELKIPRGT